jgi:hypothetical protein
MDLISVRRRSCCRARPCCSPFRWASCKGNSVVFDYSFQNVKASENANDRDYGKEIELKFGMQNIPVKKPGKIR